MTELEYLKARIVLTENVVLALGEIVQAHLPSCTQALSTYGKAWDMELDRLETERKASPT